MKCPRCGKCLYLDNLYHYPCKTCKVVFVINYSKGKIKEVKNEKGGGLDV